MTEEPKREDYVRYLATTRPRKMMQASDPTDKLTDFAKTFLPGDYHLSNDDEMVNYFLSQFKSNERKHASTSQRIYHALRSGVRKVLRERRDIHRQPFDLASTIDDALDGHNT
jgi:hypothetical protein